MSDADAALANPQEQPEPTKARRGRRRTNAAGDTPSSEAPQTNPPAAEDTGAQDGETEKTWVSKLPEPYGRHNIDLGDGRRLKLARSNRWQQARIQFVAPEGEDPKPDVKYTRWLREHGWQWRGGEEKAWTRQFAKNSEDDRYARSNSDLAMEQQFIELANLIRADKGLAEIQPLGGSRGAPF